MLGSSSVRLYVALLAEGVDRNCTSCSALTGSCVALLAEGVDRNTAAVDDNTVTYVALLAEGVDRNIDNVLGADYITRRPPRGGRG